MRLVQVQDQPKNVATSVNEFVKVLMEAVVIVLAVSFIAPGPHQAARPGPLWRRYYIDRARAGGGHHHSAGAGGDVPGHELLGHRPAQGISLGSLIIALGLLVDDAIIAVEMMVRKMEEGYDKVRAATFAYELTAMPMLTGHADHGGGLSADRHRVGDGEYTFAIFAVTVIALVLSWWSRCTSCPYLGTLLLVQTVHGGRQRPTQPTRMRCSTRRSTRPSRSWWTGACSTAGSPSGHAAAIFALGIVGMGGCSSSSSRIQPARDDGGAVVARRHLVCRQRGGGPAGWSSA